MNIIKVNINELQIHSRNQEIYSETNADQELVESILENGLLSRLVVDENNDIVSGARRFLAMRKIIEESSEKGTQYQELEVFQRSFEDEDELISFIVESNLSREKRWDQKVREGWAIHESVKKEARYDQFKGLRNLEVVPENFPEQKKDNNNEVGETLDRVANGKAYHKYSKVLKVADGLQKDENPEKKASASRLKQLAGLSLSAAETVVKEGKFELLKETPDASKKAVGEFKKSKIPILPEGSFSKGTWLKNVTDQLKEVLEVFRNEPQIFDSLCEEMNGDLMIDEDDNGVRVTLELKLS